MGSNSSIPGASASGQGPHKGVGKISRKGKQHGKSPPRPEDGLSRPASTLLPYLTHVPFRVENTVKLAGATCYHSFLIQSAAGFLTGQSYYSEEDNFEAYARANVGLSRAIGATVIVSPPDMRGLIGMAQILATIQSGIGYIYTHAAGCLWQHSALDTEIAQESDMQARLAGNTILHDPLPLAMGWASCSNLGLQVLRLHLMLVETWQRIKYGHTHWCFPGGCFQGLVWAYGADNNRDALWEVHPHPDHVHQCYLIHTCHNTGPAVFYGNGSDDAT